MKIFTILIGLTLGTAALAQPAQTGIEKGTFGMAKATLEFLASDKQTFGAAKKTACDGCATYGDLTDFIKVNSLTKADGLVNDIKKHSLMLNDEFAADAFTSEGAVLDSLRRYVLKRVTSGPERQHRTQLPAFASYQTRLTALAGGTSPDQAAAEPTLPQEAEQPASDVTTAPAGTGSSLGAWALGLSLLDLLGVAYLLFVQQRKSGTRVTALGKQPTDDSDPRIATLEDKNAHLNSSLADLNRRLSVVEKGSALPATAPSRPADRSPAGGPATGQGPVSRGMMPQNTTAPGSAPANELPRRSDTSPDRTPSATPALVGNQPRPTYQNPANPVIPPQVTPISTSQPLSPMPGQAPGSSGQLPSSVPSPATPLETNRSAGNPERPGSFGGGNAGQVAASAPAAPTRLFARTADLGNGFSVAGLLPAAERGTVYELEPTGPNTAIFRVSQSLESQQLALSDPYSYLSDACVYENNPAMGSNRIQTVVPGQLVLQADKWQITEKARIGFV